MKPLFPFALEGAGKILLLGASCLSIWLSIKKEEELEEPLFKIAIGFFALVFFIPFLNGALDLSASLTSFFEKLGSRDDLRKIILASLEKASHGSEGSNTNFHLPALSNQIIRIGVWGVVSLLAEFFFLLSSLILQILRDISLQFVTLLYPLACGVYPLFPRVLLNLSVYTLGIVFWWPIFTLITVITSKIAIEYLHSADSWGLPILALELISVGMTFSVPVITQKLLSGSLENSNLKISPHRLIKTVSRVWK